MNKSLVLKKRVKWIVPVIGSLVAVCMAVILLFPMLMMSPRDIPVAILSLDEGVEMAGERINIGETLIDNLTNTEPDAEGSSGIVNWTVMGSQPELDAAMEDNEFYAAFIIPAGYSRAYVEREGLQTLGTTLVDKLPELSSGAASLDDGASALSDGASALSDGAGTLDSGVEALAAQTSALPNQTEKLASGARSLADGLVLLQSSTPTLIQGLSSVSEGAAGTEEYVEQAASALQKLQSALTTGDQDATEVALTEAATALVYAQRYSTAVSEGLNKLDSGASSMDQAVRTLSSGAQSLQNGTQALSTGSDALAKGISSLSKGASQLNSGTDALADGATELKSGTTALAEGLGMAEESLEELPQGEGDNVIDVVINQGKNPMVSGSVTSALTAMTTSAGIEYEIAYINALPEGMTMGFTHMILMIFTYIGSYATAAIIANFMKPKRDSHRSLVRSILMQFVYILGLAALIACCVCGVIYFATGADVSYPDLALYIFFASATFQLLTVASLDWIGIAGMAIPMCLLVIGMGTAYLPIEFLPSFWQDFVYPWDPLRFMVDGFRGILYMGEGAFNTALASLMWTTAISLVFFFANVMRSTADDQNPKVAPRRRVKAILESVRSKIGSTDAKYPVKSQEGAHVKISPSEQPEG